MEDMRLALPELISRFVLRGNPAIIQDKTLFQQLNESFSAVVKGQFSEQLSRLTIANQQVNHSRPDAHTITTELEKPRSLVQEATVSPLTTMKKKHGRKSAIDQRIFELSDPAQSDSADEDTAENRSGYESTSNYSTELGEVIIQTISTVYFSLEEINVVDLPLAFKTILLQLAHFPVTITTKEVLLLPRSWAKARGVIIHYEQLSGQTFHLDDMSLEIQTFRGHNPPSTSLFSASQPEAGGATWKQIHLLGAFGLPEPKSLLALIHIFFTAAHLTTKLKSKILSWPDQQYMTPNSPILGNFLNSDVNVRREFMRLWEESGSVAEICRLLYPRAEAAAIDQYEFESAIAAGKMRVRAFQGLGKECASNLSWN